MNDLVKTEDAKKHLKELKNIVQKIEQLEKSKDIGKRDIEINKLIEELLAFINRKEELDQEYSEKTLLTVGLVHMLACDSTYKQKQISYERVYAHIDRGLSG